MRAVLLVVLFSLNWIVSDTSFDLPKPAVKKIDKTLLAYFPETTINKKTLSLSNAEEKKLSCKLNENKSGVFINLSYIDSTVIEELQKYITYTKEQEENLTTTEYQKSEFKNALFDNKEDKDNSIITYNIVN